MKSFHNLEKAFNTKDYRLLISLCNRISEYILKQIQCFYCNCPVCDGKEVHD